MAVTESCDAGLGRAAAALDLLGDRHALVDVGQRLVVAGLEAQVEQLEPGLAQAAQLVDALGQQVARVGVASSRAPGAGSSVAQQVEDLVQLARREGERVAVGQEDAVDARLRTAAGSSRTSSATSAKGRTANGLSRYVPQKSQVLLEQP